MAQSYSTIIADAVVCYFSLPATYLWLAPLAPRASCVFEPTCVAQPVDTLARDAVTCFMRRIYLTIRASTTPCMLP
eukprot:scaffold113714_cov30-Prasinocladus_malaysianus.AAC.2